MTYEISHRHLPPLRCSDLVKGAARRYVHRHADRHQWAPAVLDEVLGMLGRTEVAA